MNLATTLLHKKAAPWWLSGPALLLFTVLLLLLTAAATLSTVPCMIRLLPNGVISARSPLFRPCSLVSSR